jgi:segregation and condensation protein B
MLLGQHTARSGCRLRAKSGLNPCTVVVERFPAVPRPDPLSPAALQVLTIVAYEQPVTRADIARIRGADSDGVVFLRGHRYVPGSRRVRRPIQPPAQD